MSPADAELAEAVHPTDLTQFQLEICYALAADGKQHGLGIKEALEERYDETVHHGRLYPNLDDLVGLDLVEKGKIDKRTNSYQLADAGKDLLRRDAQRRYGIAETLMARSTGSDAR